MNQNDCFKHWYAYIYEQQENQTDDVEFLLQLLGDSPQNILEACCGGGRICVPLANAGHTVTGFDGDPYMLERLSTMAANLKNITWREADAVRCNWGVEFDVAVLGGNILINIESDMAYEAAQKLFIQKAYDCLRPGGYLFLDFNCRAEDAPSHRDENEHVIFEGTDDRGTYGRFTIFEDANDGYDAATCMGSFKRRFSLRAKDGDAFEIIQSARKHLPCWRQVAAWLTEAGFTIETAYNGYQGKLFKGGAGRATVWARKEV